MPAVLTLVLVLAVIVGVIALLTWLATKDVANAMVAVVVCGVVALGTFVYQYTQNYHNDRWVTCHVTKADIKMNRGENGGSTYRVYTNDCGVLRNTDAKFRWKWNSADIWQQIEPGHTYRFHVAGARFDKFSWFPNVFEVQKAD